MVCLVPCAVCHAVLQALPDTRTAQQEAQALTAEIEGMYTKLKYSEAELKTMEAKLSQLQVNRCILCSVLSPAGPEAATQGWRNCCAGLMLGGDEPL